MLPHKVKKFYRPYEGHEPLQARLCSSISEAVRNSEIVIEAVPDRLEIKRDVFAEALQSAREGVLLATSTLSLSLVAIQKAITRRGSPLPRVVGLRFLAPVVFIPFVEITLTEAQDTGKQSAHKEALLDVLNRWGKSPFACDVQGAADGSTVDDATDDFACTRRSAARLRLDGEVAARRQLAEARFRRKQRDGEIEAICASDLFDFDGEDQCCACLDAEPSVTSLLCGHRVLCDACAESVEQISRCCPLCRERFVRKVD